MFPHKTQAPEEVLKRVLVKQVVLNAVLGLVKQNPFLGDEVANWPGSKLLVEGVLHVVHQHLNARVHPHLLPQPPGHINPLLKAAVTWDVNHLERQMMISQFSNPEKLATFPSGWSLLLGLGHSSVA